MDIALRLLVGGMGALLVLAVSLSAVRTVIVPRSIATRLTSQVFLPLVIR